MNDHKHEWSEPEWTGSFIGRRHCDACGAYIETLLRPRPSKWRWTDRAKVLGVVLLIVGAAILINVLLRDWNWYEGFK